MYTPSTLERIITVTIYAGLALVTLPPLVIVLLAPLMGR